LSRPPEPSAPPRSADRFVSPPVPLPGAALATFLPRFPSRLTSPSSVSTPPPPFRSLEPVRTGRRPGFPFSPFRLRIESTLFLARFFSLNVPPLPRALAFPWTCPLFSYFTFSSEEPACIFRSPSSFPVGFKPPSKQTPLWRLAHMDPRALFHLGFCKRNSWSFFLPPLVIFLYPRRVPLSARPTPLFRHVFLPPLCVPPLLISPPSLVRIGSGHEFPPSRTGFARPPRCRIRTILLSSPPSLPLTSMPTLCPSSNFPPASLARQRRCSCLKSGAAFSFGLSSLGSGPSDIRVDRCFSPPPPFFHWTWISYICFDLAP